MGTPSVSTPGEHRSPFLATVGDLNKTILLPLGQFFGVAFACHLVLTPGNTLPASRRRTWADQHQECGKLMVQLLNLPLGLQSVDVALKGGGDDEAVLRHRSGGGGTTASVVIWFVVSGSVRKTSSILPSIDGS